MERRQSFCGAECRGTFRRAEYEEVFGRYIHLTGLCALLQDTAPGRRNSFRQQPLAALEFSNNVIRAVLSGSSGEILEGRGPGLTRAVPNSPATERVQPGVRPADKLHERGHDKALPRDTPSLPKSFRRSRWKDGKKMEVLVYGDGALKTRSAYMGAGGPRCLTRLHRGLRVPRRSSSPHRRQRRGQDPEEAVRDAIRSKEGMSSCDPPWEPPQEAV